MPQDDIQKLYEHNIKPEHYNSAQWTSTGNIKADPGPIGRRYLNFAYAVAFTCLLRIDEVLRIRHEHITLLPKNKHLQDRLKLVLDFRKTAQFGSTLVHLLREFKLYSSFYFQRSSHLFYTGFLEILNICVP